MTVQTEHVTAPTPTTRSNGGTIRVLDGDGKADPSTDPGLPSDKVVAIYKAMARARLVDRWLTDATRDGRVPFHLSALGEEASIVGAAAALRDQDWIFPTHRELGALLWRGMPLATYFAHVLGNAGDPARGRQLPGHPTGRAHGCVSSSPLSGTQLPHAVGVAWAAKIKRHDVIAAAFFGDGAANSADFHTAANFAGVFKVPVLLLCRNNAEAETRIADRAVAYGLRAERCDGGDALATYRSVTDAIARIAAGAGPTLVEMRTRRLEGSDEGGSADALFRLRRHLERTDSWDRAKDEAWAAEVRAEIDASFEEADKHGFPPRETMFHDVYEDRPWHLREQERDLLSSEKGRGQS